jgi:hypothetical protein
MEGRTVLPMKLVQLLKVHGVRQDLGVAEAKRHRLTGLSRRAPNLAEVPGT